MNLEDPQLRELATGATSRLDFWVKFLRTAKIRTVLEVGVWKADFTRHLLQECATIERFYMLDPWAHLLDWNKPLNLGQDAADRAYEEAVQKTAFASAKTVVLRGRTREVIGSIPDGSLDFAYIDGDHTLRGITIDLIKVWPKVKPGGFMGGDDFTRDIWQHSSHYEPTLVCPFSVYFAEAMEMPIMSLPFNQFLMQKRPDARFSFTDTTGDYGNLSLKQLCGGWANLRPVWWVKHTLRKVGLLK